MPYSTYTVSISIEYSFSQDILLLLPLPSTFHLTIRKLYTTFFQSYFQVKQLRQLLKTRNLPVSGTKAVIADRLLAAVKAQHGIEKELCIRLHRVDLRAAQTMQSNRPKKTARKNEQAPQKNTSSLQLQSSQSPKKSENEEAPQNSARSLRLTTTMQTERSSNGLLPTKRAKIINREDGPKQRRRPRTQTKKVASTALMMKPSLRKFELIWAHIRGYRNWPGIIERETEDGRYEIHFFGDYSMAIVRKSQIMHLLEGFNDYYADKAPTALLVKAITEAEMFILDQNHRQECPICKMFEIKNTLAENLSKKTD